MARRMEDFPVYCRDEDELARRCRTVKLMRCPVCGKVGALILHGPLRGCCGCARWGRVRGQRFWCSNRHRRRGCGHTFSMVFSWVLRGRQATAPQLWAFLGALRRGEGLARAWRGAARLSWLRTRRIHPPKTPDIITQRARPRRRQAPQNLRQIIRPRLRPEFGS